MFFFSTSNRWESKDLQYIRVIILTSLFCPFALITFLDSEAANTDLFSIKFLVV